MSSRFGRTPAAWSALILFSLVNFAAAYVLEGAKWYQPSLTMHLQFPPPGSVLLDGSVDFYKSFENAEMLWNEQIANFQLAWVEEPNDPNNRHDGDGVTQVSMQTSIYNQPFGSNVLAVTLLNYRGMANPSNPAQMTETDIIFNTSQWIFNSFRGPNAPAPKVQDMHRIGLHELGHVLGLDHSGESGAIMNPNASGTYFLQPDDIAGAQALYGAAPNAPDPSGNARLANISTRAQVDTGERVEIGGFIVQNATKPVLIRAIGPSLAAAGVAGALADPVLELHDGSGAVIASNNDWKQNAAEAQQISATGIAPTNDRESAIYANLAPGNYTAIVSGNGGTGGVALVEVYDLARNSGRIANISTRGLVQSGDSVMIGGFIIAGPQSMQIVVRALGPSLQGVSGLLADPALELRNANGELLVANNDFADDPQNASAVANYGLRPPNARESAVATELAPGNFTAIVRGQNGSTGVGLVEVYDVDQ